MWTYYMNIIKYIISSYKIIVSSTERKKIEHIVSTPIIVRVKCMYKVLEML